MQTLYDGSAPKKATNLSVNSDLLAKSRELNINLSATLETALSNVLARTEAAKWQKQNAQAIRSYNEIVDEHGCFGEEYRAF